MRVRKVYKDVVSMIIMQKKRGLVIGVLLGLVLSSIVVSAASTSEVVEAINEGVAASVEVAEPILKFLVGETGNNEDLFAKFLFLLLIVIVVFIALKNIDYFEEHGFANFLVSLVVSLLAVRFLAESEWVKTIILPYSVFGVAVTALLPMLLYVYVVETTIQNEILRKFAFVFAFFVFIGLYISRFDQVGETAWIYFAAALGTLVLLFADKTIRRYVLHWAIEKRNKELKDLANNQVMTDLKSKYEALAKETDKGRRKTIEKEIRDLRKTADAVLRA